MREIKFRAWDKDDEEMHKDVTPMYRDGELENIIFDYENAGYNFIDIEIKYCDTVFLYEDNPYIIMQYTGLKDKNCKEIYEGDIIRGPHDFGPGGFSVIAAPVKYHVIHGYQLHYFLLEQTEVIGNIYENPELLGDSQ